MVCICFTLVLIAVWHQTILRNDRWVHRWCHRIRKPRCVESLQINPYPVEHATSMKYAVKRHVIYYHATKNILKYVITLETMEGVSFHHVHTSMEILLQMTLKIKTEKSKLLVKGFLHLKK